MADWLYLASDTKKRATLVDTLNAATRFNCVWRASRADGGALIPHVGDLRPNDTLVLGFRQPTMRAYLRGRIVPATSAAHGTSVIDVVGAPYAAELQRAGYPVTNGQTEVVHLKDVEECCFDLVGTYKGQNAIRYLDPRDASQMRHGASISVPAVTRTSRARGAPRNAHAPPPNVRPTVARTIPRANPCDRCFDAYVMIDWSASRVPARPNAKDSIWVAFGEWDGNCFGLNVPQKAAVQRQHQCTRFDARKTLDDVLSIWLQEKRRILVGLDFAFGYPSGFASALGLNGDWRDVHRYIKTQVHDDPQNAHDGARFAASCNARITPANEPGPFWGCHATDVVPGRLMPRHVGFFTFPYGPARLESLRLTDMRAQQQTITQPVWKLNCGVSVGMQTILGIKHLAEMRCAFEGSSRVWPFETGFGTTPSAPEIWFAEIFPSLVPIDAGVSGRGGPPDREQVESCVLEAAFRDATSQMPGTLAHPSISQSEVGRVLHEEGWMLFL